MYRVAISKNGKQVILRPVVEAEDAIYWVNRLSEMGFKTDVLREEAVKTSKRVETAAQVA